MWLHIILDGLAMAIVFTLTLCLVSYIDPQSFTKMYPLGIQKIAPPIPEDSKKRKNIMLIALWTFEIIFSVVSVYLSGIRGFRLSFLAGYIQMFMVDMGDLFGWNIFFREKMGQKLELPGTEGSELYSRKNWLLKLGLPNHFGIWPIIVCPLCGLVNAGVESIICQIQNF